MAQEIKKINGVYMGSQEIASTRFAGDANLRAYYKFDTGALTTDSSGNGYTLTNNNTVADGTGKFGGAADLGASNSNKSLYTNNSMGIQNGDQSLSFWANFYSFDGGNDKVFQKCWDGGNPGTNSQWMIDMIEPNATQFTVRVYGNGASGTWTHGLSTGTWHHFVMTYTNSSSNCLLYCDGQRVISFTANNSLSSNTTNLFILGAAGDRSLSVPSSAYSSIKFDDVALFSRVLTSDEIYSLYKTGVKKLNGQVNLNPELESTSLRNDANLVAYWRLEDVNDETANNNDLTNNGTATFIAGKFTNGLNLVAASSQYLSITDAAQTGLDLSGDFSIGFWLKLNSYPATNAHFALVGKWEIDGGQGAYRIQYTDTAGVRTLRVLTSADGTASNFNVIDYTTSFSLGVWYYVVVNCDISNAAATQHQFFINGNSVGNGTVVYEAGTVSSIYNSNADFMIGAFNNDGAGIGSYFNGMFDDISVFSRLLTATEIQNLYNTNIKKYNGISNV